jgi:hypothetical protein
MNNIFTTPTVLFYGADNIDSRLIATAVEHYKKHFKTEETTLVAIKDITTEGCTIVYDTLKNHSQHSKVVTFEVADNE